MMVITMGQAWEGLSPGRPQGSPPPNPATPALTQSRSDESNVGMVRAGEADDVGWGPITVAYIVTHVVAFEEGF